MKIGRNIIESVNTSPASLLPQLSGVFVRFTFKYTLEQLMKQRILLMFELKNEVSTNTNLAVPSKYSPYHKK